jgi:predicted transposase YbfD/YdcC
MTSKTKSPVLDSLLQAFGDVPDPRVERTKLHPLVNVLTMALFGAICGADGWEALALFAKMRAKFFSSFLEMPNGTPSEDTFRRVFEALDPRAFQDAFRRWLEPFLDNLKGQTIALDGKTLRGALAHAAGHSGAFHLMHVWATEQRLLLAQQAVEGAPGEIHAAEELLKLLDIKGATVTTDANSCTAGFSRAVREAGAHYVLALKGNRGALLRHVQKLSAEAEEGGWRGVKRHETKDRGHGRHECRIVRAITIKALPPSIAASWTDLKTAVIVDRIRLDKKLTVERSYYVTSHAPDPKLLSAKIRGHWSIENQLHHCLDVSFAEDRRTIRDENGAQNFALIARYALSMLKRETTKKSVAMKRRQAAWGETYVLEVLSCGFAQI